MATGNKRAVTWCFMPSQPKYYIKKSCDADKYRRMAGLTETVATEKGAENRGIVGRIFGMKYR